MCNKINIIFKKVLKKYENKPRVFTKCLEMY